MIRSGAFLAAGILAFLWASTLSEAQDRGPSFRTPPVLPSTPNRVGPLKRDKDGRIVPSGPALPPDDSIQKPASSGILLPPLWARDQLLDSGFGAPSATTALYKPGDLRYLQNGRRQARHAQRQQAVINRILREERIARLHARTSDPTERTLREKALLGELTRRDKSVRRHEQRHYFTAQPYAQSPEYWYVIGPGNLRFAIAGLTRFDTSAIEGDAGATIRKLDTLRRAALAPTMPSYQDRRVADELARLILKLRRR